MSDAFRFAQKLRLEMSRQRITIRGLARKLDPSNVDRAERNIYRWLAGEHLPSQASRDALADALGVSRETFDPEEEDESPFDLIRRGLDKLERNLT